MRQLKLSATEGRGALTAVSGEWRARVGAAVGGGGERSGTDYTGGQHCSGQESGEGDEWRKRLVFFSKGIARKGMDGCLWVNPKNMREISCRFTCVIKSPLCVNCTLSTFCHNNVCLRAVKSQGFW